MFRQAARMLRPIFRDHRVSALIVMVTSLLWGLQEALLPWFYGRIADQLDHLSGDGAGRFALILPFLLGFAGAWIFIELSFILHDYRAARFYPALLQEVRQSFLERLSRQPQSYFSDRLSGALAQHVTGGADAVAHLIYLLFDLVFPVLFALLLSSILLCVTNLWIGLTFTAWFMLHLGGSFYLTQRTGPQAAQRQSRLSDVSGKIVDVLSHIFTVRLFARMTYEMKDLKALGRLEQRTHQALRLRQARQRVWVTLCSLAYVFFVLFYSVWLWSNHRMSTGDVLLVLSSFANLLGLTWHLSGQFSDLFEDVGFFREALRQISDPEISNESSRPPFQAIGGAIRFDQVDFSYRKETPLFRGLNVRIEPGEKVGLVGGSGSGKSSLVHILLRVYDIQSGRILVDGQDISQVRLDSLREAIAFIPQDPSLFQRSLYENIAYGAPEASMEEILWASEQACCDEFIRKLPQGYETLVGERGLKLSGGQRQRIAIARALLKRQAKILILDEATSALDSLTESRIQETLLHLMEGRTTLVVAHRLSTLHAMDRILVFDQGRVVEEGSHESLMEADGHYAELWRLQGGDSLHDEDEEFEDDEYEDAVI